MAAVSFKALLCFFVFLFQRILSFTSSLTPRKCSTTSLEREDISCRLSLSISCVTILNYIRIAQKTLTDSTMKCLYTYIHV